MHYGSFQYKLLTRISEHEVGVEYYADGEYVELKKVTLHESRYFGGDCRKSRYGRDKVIKNLKTVHTDELHDMAVKLNDGEY